MTKKEAYDSVKPGDKIQVDVGIGPQEMEIEEKMPDYMRVVGRVNHPDRDALVLGEFVYDTVYGPHGWKLMKYRRGGKKTHEKEIS